MSLTQQGADAAPPVAATYFLTWHGSIVRVDKASQRLIHGRLFPVRDVATDWRMALPQGGLTAPMPGPEDARLVLRPGGTPRQVTIKLDDFFLCAEPNAGEVRFSRRNAGPWETFLLITDDELAALRYILAQRWTTVLEGDASPESCWAASLRPGFNLHIGALTCDLRRHFPRVLAGQQAWEIGVHAVKLAHAGEIQAHAEIRLARRAQELRAAPVDAGMFAAAPDSRLILQGDAEYGMLPLAAGLADEDWMIDAWSQPGERRLGKLWNKCGLVRETDKYVVLERGQEGLIFDARGASNETGYLFGLNITRDGVLAREGDHFFVNGDAARESPRLAGPHAVFYGGNLSDYYHWTIDAMLPLFVMAPHLPPGTKLLIPGTLRGLRDSAQPDAAPNLDYMAVLQEWGFGDMQMVEIDTTICHVGEVYWLDGCSIEQMPAKFVQAARSHMLARLGPRQSGKHIYIRHDQMRAVENNGQVSHIARGNGFTVHTLDGMTPRAQMELFRDADFVVAPHGTSLANLLLCAPGTKIIELSPDCEFRPIFSQISQKLDLVHAVLPCPTSDGGFDGDMTVDAARFKALLRLLQNRQEAA